MTSFEAFEVQSHASQGCSTVELLEEITANRDLCVHIARELLKVCEMHVSLPDLPLHPTFSDTCTGVSYRAFFKFTSVSFHNKYQVPGIWGVSRRPKVWPRTSMCLRARACTDTEAGDTSATPPTLS